MTWPSKCENIQSKLEFGQKREQETHRHNRIHMKKKRFRKYIDFFSRVISPLFLDELSPLEIEENKIYI